MKIEGNAPQIDTRALDRLEKAVARTSEATSAQAPSTSGTDQLSLSPEAQLARVADEAARQTPGIRQDLVDQMRELLDRGEIGHDAERTADALIEHWLNS